MSREIQYILEKLDNLERAFLQSQKNNVQVTAKADTVIITDGKVDGLTEVVNANTESIEETNIGLMETYEETANNATSIDELELALEEVYEMIGG